MEEKNQNKIHHTNIVVGSNGKDVIFEILENDLMFKKQGNPDFLFVENETFGIDEARNFGVWMIGKPLVGETKVALISVKSLTFEAQNALLKALEEPPVGTYIFINIESLGGLLPTFLSRVRILESEKLSKKIFDISAQKFLKGNIKEKLSLINSLTKKTDKSALQELVKNLEEVAYENNSSSKNLKNILKAKIFASSRGSSPKMLLEWLTCVLE